MSEPAAARQSHFQYVSLLQIDYAFRFFNGDAVHTDVTDRPGRTTG